MKAEMLTLVLVNLAGIMEKADEALLPSVYKEVGEALNTDPTGLGSLTLFRSLVQCACYPLAAYLSVRRNRAHVIALGALLWAAATFAVAISTTYLEVAMARGLNGIGLAMVVPSVQSLVADSTNKNNRGTAFGWLQLSTNFGYVVGGMSATLMASTSFMGIAGWRLAFHSVAILSAIVGLLVGFFASDPRFSSKDTIIRHGLQQKSFGAELKDLIDEAKMVVKIPSFQIIVSQGISGTFPWSAFSFATMWLELMGFSHEVSALLVMLFWTSTSLGSLFAGFLGDNVAKRLPNSGRIILSQISSASAIPIAAVLLLFLPSDSSTAFLHGLVFVIMGFMASWNNPATNQPIFAEIVPEKSRTSIYALDRSFESLIASFATPVVGLLAQHVFGYEPVTDSATEIATDRENAKALAKALYAATGIPMTICCFIYCFLYGTYPRDRELARVDALGDDCDVASSSTSSRHDDMYFQLPEEGNESREVDLESAGEERVGFDDGGEGSLLSHQTKISKS